MGAMCSCFGCIPDELGDGIENPNNHQGTFSDNGYGNFISKFAALFGTNNAMPLASEEPPFDNEFVEEEEEEDDDDDENCCPTCLHKYTKENPKIIAKCSHHYHLPCIYAWKERSNLCPCCSRVMEFDEST